MKKYILMMLVVFVLPRFAWAEAYTLTVDGMVCDFCVQGIPKKLNEEFKDQKIKDIHVDLDKKTVTFEAEPVDQKKLEKVLKKAGYNLKAVEIKSAAPQEVKKVAPTTAPETKVEKK